MEDVTGTREEEMEARNSIGPDGVSACVLRECRNQMAGSMYIIIRGRKILKVDSKQEIH